MTLTDDETAPGTIALTTAPISVGEDDSATQVTVTATLGGSVTLASATEVAVSVGGGSATSGTDYTAVTDFTLTIAATESTGTGTFTLTPTQDSVSEGDETIDVTGSAGDITVTKATMTLTDDETAPGTIALTTAPISVGEDDSATQVTVTATLGGSVTLASATEVAVSVGGGSATSGTDYTAVTDFTLIIAATESTGTGTFTLTPKQDSVSEGDETIDVTGSAGDITVTKATMTLTDDETAPGTIALTTDPTSVGEDDSATQVTVTATLGGSVTLASATEVAVSVGGGSATSGTDYTAATDFTLTIAATESTGTGTFTLTPTQDSVSEGDETIDVTGTASDFTITKAEMTLTDDETAPGTITLTTAPISVGEDDSATEVRVTATLGGSVTLSSATEVTVLVGGGSATSGTDYTAVDNFTLTIAATESTGTGTFTLTPKQDSLSEGDETIDVTGSAGDITVTKAEMTLTDDETAPTAITLTTAPISVGEDDSATQVTVTATLGGSVTLASATEVAVSVGGGSATSGTDYTAVADFTLTIAATESTGTGTFTLTPTQDSVSEGDETIDITGTAGDFTVTKAEMTLTDDETAPGTIALTTDPTSVGEDASETEVTVTATLDGSVTLASATEVTVSVGGGTATSGTDYTAVTDFTLTIAATESTGTGTFMLTPTQDSVSEGDETIDITGTAGDFTVTKAEMTLTDDDQPVTTQIALELDPGTVPEGAGATAITVTAKLSGDARAAPTEVTVSVTGDTATAEADFAAVAPITLTIAAGQATATASFMLTPVDDAVDEADETLAVSGVTAAPELLVTPAALTLGDDDERGVTVQPTDLHLRPGERKSYTLRLTSEPTATAMVEVIVPPASILDLTFEPATLTFTPATWQIPQTVDVTASVDASATRLELEHAVSGGDYDQLPAQPVAVSIDDNQDGAPDDNPPEDDPPDEDPPALTIADVRAVESAGQVTFTVRLAAASGRLVTVDYATVSGTATEGTDYTGTTGALTFRPGGALTRTIAVPIVDDALDEVDETFRMRLSGARHATLAGGGATLAATGTILDDDEPAVSIAADAAAVQEGQAARFTVTRTGHATEPLTVTVEVTETGSVIAGTVPVRVSFEANVRTATLVVATEDDTTDEPDGAVTAAIVAGGGYVTMDPASATVTISDNDAAPALTIADARVLESAGEIEFTVRMAAASGHRVTVACVSEDGTALADQDYEAELGTLALEPGQTVGKIRVAILDDTLDEPDETFTMLLSDPAHATVADGTATGTIEDDDPSVAQAWLSRFGRTVATHVMDAVGGRLAEGAGQGSQASVAGRRLEPAADVAPSDWFEPASFRTMEFRELLAGSSVDLTAVRADESGGEGGRWTAWGRGGATRFGGKEAELSVGGTVAGGVVGADYEWGRMLAGLSAAYSGGGGDFTVRGTGAARDRTGDVGSWLLSAHPYVRVEVSDRLAAWALAGYGVGRMSLDEDARDVETGISMTMGAFAARGVLLSPEQNGGLSLAMKSDGFLLRIASEAADELPAAAAEVQRVRLVLDGSVDVLRGPGGVLTPSLQVGGRYDGGDAETGLGLEVGGGLRYSYPEWGLTVQANGRLLLSHEDRDYEEWGAGGSIRIAPGSQGRGLSVGMNTSWGAAASGVERLWSEGAARPTGGAAADDAAGPPGRLEAELGYGIDALGGGGLLTPYAGVTLGDGGDNTYRLGGRLDIGQSFSLGLEADRSQSLGALPEHELRLTGTVRW